MTKLKVYLLAFFAIAIGAGVYAFSKPANSEEKITRGAGQYRYTQSSDDINDLQAPGHWVAVGQTTPSCENTGDIPCYVNYTGSDFDAFLSASDLDDLMGIAVKIKEVQP